jgi:acetylornithine/N-succinyldiaminopimelate aminotransferase
MMKPLPVYGLLPIELVRAAGTRVWDADGKEYLDLYGGHAVISIGHGHAQWADAIAQQASTLGYYSNSVELAIQDAAAKALGAVSGLHEHDVFFVNSGAEANENAMKIASFVTGRPRIIAFRGAFHGRTSLAVSATDDEKIIAPVNRSANVVHVDLEDIDAVRSELEKGDVAGVIIEGIQGVAGCVEPSADFLRALERACADAGALLILDEIQSGCGRTGQYFAYEHAGIKPLLITAAKGIGNGFPVGAVFVHHSIELKVGSLGTTFGGGPMACAAVRAVADVMMQDALMANAAQQGGRLAEGLRSISGVNEIRGRGLMLGVVVADAAAVRRRLWREHAVLVGSSSDPQVLRLLPPLTLSLEETERTIDVFASVIQEMP